MNRPVLTLTTLALATGAAFVSTIVFPTHAEAQRRGAPGGPRQPLTTVSVSLGKARYDARVDANCHVDERATRGNTRAYFVVMYPWFGQRPPVDQPQWRLNLEIRRAARANRYDEFTFSFLDGSRSGLIQTVAGSPRIGSGTVRVTPRDSGARFDVDGRTRQGVTIRATIDCPVFQKSEGGGG